MGRMKWVLARLGLWKFADWVNTRGRGYRYSETDGVSYSYSLFDHHGTLRRAFEQVIVVNLDGDGRHAELGASHVAMIGVGKKKASVRSPHC